MGRDAETPERWLRVETTTVAAEGVLVVEFVDPEGGELAAWEPGAHLELVLPSGLVRHYSLCGDPADRSRYRVAVLRVAVGRGGSIEVHEANLVGAEILVRGPRNHFPLVAADSYLLLAGGIGVTPILAMVRVLAARGEDWRMVYGGRSETSMAFREELRALGADRLTEVPEDRYGFPDLAGALGGVPVGTAVYCCGPEAMIAQVELLCGELDGKVDLHVEHFSSGQADDAVLDGDVSFTVELRRSGTVLEIPADRTILQAVHDVLPNHPYSCLAGECGSCETRVLDGSVDHRDQVLTDEEREDDDCMMICVSRAAGRHLVLDL